MIFFTALLNHNEVQHLKQRLNQEWFCLIRSISDQHFCGIVKESKFETLLTAMPVEALAHLEYLSRNEFCGKILDENRIADIKMEGSKSLFDAALDIE